MVDVYGNKTFMVVIPIQTISFYNKMFSVTSRSPKVVIPIQTISFYNSE